MNKLLDLGNRYARESTWKDYALVKACLFSMGVIAGMRMPEKYKKPVTVTAACMFAATYVPLMKKVLRISKNQ